MRISKMLSNLDRRTHMRSSRASGLVAVQGQEVHQGKKVMGPSLLMSLRFPMSHRFLGAERHVDSGRANSNLWISTCMCMNLTIHGSTFMKILAALPEPHCRHPVPQESLQGLSRGMTISDVTNLESLH